MKTIPLLSNRFRLIGIILLIPGLLTGYLYFFGGKPEFFVSRIFAFVTSYAETRYWVKAQTNLLDEMAALFIIIGLAFLVFSKEKLENEHTNEIRLKAFIYSSYFTILVWIIIFIYGWAIFIFSSFIFIVFLLSNLVIFRFILYNYRTKKTNKINNL